MYEVAGLKGMKSVAFRKSFKTAEARAKWIEKQDGNVTHLEFRDPA